MFLILSIFSVPLPIPSTRAERSLSFWSFNSQPPLPKYMFSKDMIKSQISLYSRVVSYRKKMLWDIYSESSFFQAKKPVFKTLDPNESHQNASLEYQTVSYFHWTYSLKKPFGWMLTSSSYRALLLLGSKHKSTFLDK